MYKSVSGLTCSAHFHYKPTLCQALFMQTHGVRSKAEARASLWGRRLLDMIKEHQSSRWAEEEWERGQVGEMRSEGKGHVKSQGHWKDLALYKDRKPLEALTWGCCDVTCSKRITGASQRQPGRAVRRLCSDTGERVTTDGSWTRTAACKGWAMGHILISSFGLVRDTFWRYSWQVLLIHSFKYTRLNDSSFVTWEKWRMEMPFPELGKTAGDAGFFGEWWRWGGGDQEFSLGHVSLECLLGIQVEVLRKQLVITSLVSENSSSGDINWSHQHTDCIYILESGRDLFFFFFKNPPHTFFFKNAWVRLE